MPIPAQPIPEGPEASGPPAFIGRAGAAAARQGAGAAAAPFMAANGRSNLHDDAYMTDTYTGPGPARPEHAAASTFQGAECASVTFDRAGRIVAVCVGVEHPRLVLLDPRTLDLLASSRCRRDQPGAANPFNDFSGGGYFYLDNPDRAVIPTTTGTSG